VAVSLIYAAQLVIAIGVVMLAVLVAASL